MSSQSPYRQHFGRSQHNDSQRNTFMASVHHEPWSAVLPPHTDKESNVPTLRLNLSSLRPASTVGSTECHSAPKSRRRKYHNKSSSGCITCKAMRIKCDESKPSCQRCTRGKRQCQGYAERKAWIFEPWTKKIRSSAPSTGVIAPDDLGSSSERRSLQYFCEVTVPALATWAFTRSAQNFWLHYVRQSIQSVTAVRHLATALASRLEGITSFPANGQPCFSYEQYTRGLSGLSHVQRESGTETMLLGSQLIAVYEYLNSISTAPQSLTHLSATLRMLVSLPPGVPLGF